MSNTIPIIQPGLYYLLLNEINESNISINGNNKNTIPKVLSIKDKKNVKSTYHSQILNEEDYQLFYVYFDEEDESYLFISYYSNKCIGFDLHDSLIGKPIVELPIGFTENKKWKIIEHVDRKDNVKRYFIQNKMEMKKIGIIDVELIENDENENDDDKMNEINEDIFVLQINSELIQLFQFQKIEPKDNEMKSWIDTIRNVKNILSLKEWKINDFSVNIFKKELQISQNVTKLIIPKTISENIQGSLNGLKIESIECYGKHLPELIKCNLPITEIIIHDDNTIKNNILKHFSQLKTIKYISDKSIPSNIKKQSVMNKLRNFSYQVEKVDRMGQYNKILKINQMIVF